MRREPRQQGKVPAQGGRDFHRGWPCPVHPAEGPQLSCGAKWEQHPTTLTVRPLTMLLNTPWNSGGPHGQLRLAWGEQAAFQPAGFCPSQFLPFPVPFSSSCFLLLCPLHSPLPSLSLPCLFSSPFLPSLCPSLHFLSHSLLSLPLSFSASSSLHRVSL